MNGAARSHDINSPMRSLRSSLARRLIGVTLLATLLLGGIIYLETRSLLTDAVETQLDNLQRSRARSIASGIDAIGSTVSVIAADDETSEALTAFASAFAGLGVRSDLLDQGERQALELYYESTYWPAAQAAGLELPPSADLVPTDPVAQYLQFHYIVDNPNPEDERFELTTADGDASSYATAHDEHHTPLYETWGKRFGDLLLVDLEGNIVYSSAKRTDLGRNLESTFIGNGLRELIDRRLAGAALGEAVFVDFQEYSPVLGSPTLFAAAAVSGAQGSIGAVVVQIPVEALNDLTTMGGEWVQAGLGETGEVYVVGRDLLLRSDSRVWLEDEEAYLTAVSTEGYPPDLADAVARYGTTVLQQPVDTAAVETALDGERFLGRVEDYLGRESLTSAARVDSEYFDWVVVAQVSTAETGRSLSSYIRRILLTAAILVPSVGLFGVLLAMRFTRPFVPVVQSASQVAGGDLDVDVPDLGRNELGDVARRIGDLAGSLRSLERAVVSEKDETRRLLLAALPPRIVARYGEGTETVDDLVDSATVVAITVRRLVEGSSIDPETAADLAARLSRDLEAVATSVGLERVRSSADQHLFVAGLGRSSTDVDKAAEFAVESVFALDRFTEGTGVDIEYRIGLCSGNVISGLIDADQITYGVFGGPPSIALALASSAAPGQIVIDRGTSHDLGDEWKLRAAPDMVDLGGRSLDAQVLLGLASTVSESGGSDEA